MNNTEIQKIKDHKTLTSNYILIKWTNWQIWTDS